LLAFFPVLFFPALNFSSSFFGSFDIFLLTFFSILGASFFADAFWLIFVSAPP
jgi:hypothetical protein